jgi:dTDP-4-amino-4,6-dideoxygalactose transaminase
LKAEYKDNLEKLLCKNHKKKYCLLTGNATTALYLSLKSLPNNIKKIGIINNSCIHVPISIILAKKKIVFIDINLKNFSFDFEDLKRKKIDAIIAIHSFGYKCDIEKLKSYSKKNKIFLIEDLAVAQGLDRNSKKPVGSFGEISILSFGKGKIIDAGGGGALLTDNLDIFNNISILNDDLDNCTNLKKKYMDQLSKIHTKTYNQKYIFKNNINSFEYFRSKVKSHAKNFLFKFENFRAKKIYKKTLKINEYIKLRIKNYIDLYKELSQKKNDKYIFFKIKSSFIPWRFNIFFKENQDRNFAIKELLKKKINISSWYSGSDAFFDKNKNLKNSKYVSNNILNIWINEEFKKSYRNKVVNFLHKL